MLLVLAFEKNLNKVVVGEVYDFVKTLPFAQPCFFYAESAKCAEEGEYGYRTTQKNKHRGVMLVQNALSDASVYRASDMVCTTPGVHPDTIYEAFRSQLANIKAVQSKPPETPFQPQQQWTWSGKSAVTKDDLAMCFILGVEAAWTVIRSPLFLEMHRRIYGLDAVDCFREEEDDREKWC